MSVARLLVLTAASLPLLSAPFAMAEHKPNALSPEEITAGWLMLFDGESTFGWKAEGDAKVENGKLVVGGARPARLTSAAEFGQAEISFNFHNPVGKPARGGSLNFLNYSSSLKGASQGGRNGGVAWQENGSGPVVIETPTDQVVVFETIKVRPVALKDRGQSPRQLFNGNDLTGWRVFRGEPKRERSQFTVTANHELALKNGPGDLQTEDEWADFVLQLECKTNGKALNSGVFFRCLPGQYQQGYEAQIHNGYKQDDRTKPTDYGTGAVYRRVPARKVVSNDNEWFTLTVLAKGPRISTWVNGYPVVSWIDERKPAANARNGLYTKKGPISIQGHDPTTDLLFRNIRILELK